MNTPDAWLVLPLLAAAALAGCRERIADGPPDINYGEDVCHACGMIVSDERFACAIVAADQRGELHSSLYDDIGGMVADGAAFPPETIHARYVHDFPSHRWIDASEAFYVRSETIQSPMAWGVAAFKSIDGAQAMRNRVGGEVLSWKELNALEFSNTNGPG